MSSTGNSHLRHFALVGVLWCFVGTLACAEERPLSSRAPWKTSRVQGSPEAPEPYRIVPAFPRVRFEKPTSIEEIAGANRLLVTEREGRNHVSTTFTF